MEFFIRKDSLEPVLKMQLIQDGRNDYMNFYERLGNSSISFSMKKVDTGEFVILNKAGGIVQKTIVDNHYPEEYYIYYRWQASDVSEVGRYQGQFTIELLDQFTELVVPIREDLYINIQDSFGVL
jgi:hypothetical protein